MTVPLWVWLATVGVVLALLLFDFLSHVRTPHSPSLKEAGAWSAVYIGIAILFGLGLLWITGARYGGEYFAGWITEYSLSVDNLFIFVIIMSRFAVPRQYQQKVLLVGIVIALVMRGVFIALGAAAIATFSWVFYLFGAFLIYTAWRLAREGHGGSEEFEENAVLRAAERVLPTTSDYHGDRLTARVDGRRLVTPMLIVMVAIGTTDLLFALDSIPAIFGLTDEPYIVFTANAFALLGLRQLFFLIGGLLERLVYLSVGLSVILGFIGVKLILEALHTNELPFVNGGEPVEWAPEVPIWLSLSIILGTLLVTTVASLLRTRGEAHGLGAPDAAAIAEGSVPVPEDRPRG